LLYHNRLRQTVLPARQNRKLLLRNDLCNRPRSFFGKCRTYDNSLNRLTLGPSPTVVRGSE